jgi:ATPase family associated with various cellular activities (AAA)
MAALPRLETYALAAIATQVLPPTPSDLPELEFLRQQLNRVMPNHATWLEGLRLYLQAPHKADLPMILLARDLKMNAIELLSVALAVAVEEQVMVGRALARIQAPLGGSRPTLSLLSTAFSELFLVQDLSPMASLVNGTAVQSGLLHLLNEGMPLPEQTIKIPLPLCFALKGEDGAFPGTTIGLPSEANIPLPASVKTMAETYATSLKANPRRLLLIRSGNVDEARCVVALLASHLQRRAAFIETDQLSGMGPWLRLRKLLPVFCLNLAPGDRHRLPVLPFYAGVMVAISTQDGSIEAPNHDVISWNLPVPDQAERRDLWQQAIGDPALANTLATSHRHTASRIAQLGRLAQHHREIDGNTQSQAATLRAAAWSGEGIGLDALAQPLKYTIDDEALVLPPNLQQELQVLLLRAQARDTLITGLGASAVARYYPGVKALFVGPSGTGKTLAAGWLATKLGIPLYRVDLAGVVSKYIGETEKNLSQLLSRAEQAEVVLLFDEADSLFGKRTDVQQANDRFANTQTNYLLQRIETFDGITILTSNSRQRFDTAFSRRLDMVIDFPLPRPEERRSLWQSHLGENHALTPQDFNQLAATIDLCGGHIRNVVLTAAVLAQAENRAIGFSDILQGLGAEYRKLGRQMPALKQAT